MRKQLTSICAWAVAALLGFAGSTWAADVPTVGTSTTHDIAGTYELVKRVTSDGKEVLPPAIGALYTMKNGRGNFYLDKTGVSNEAPAVTNHCSPVTLKDGRVVFEPAGEGIVESFDTFRPTAHEHDHPDADDSYPSGARANHGQLTD